MSPLIVTIVIGLSMRIGPTSSQEAAHQGDPFTITMGDESGVQHFESLKIEEAAPALSSQTESQIDKIIDSLLLPQLAESTKPKASFKSKFALDFTNNISNNTKDDATTKTSSSSRQDLARVMRQQFDKFKKSLSENGPKHSNPDKELPQFVVTAPATPSLITDTFVTESEPLVALVDDESVNSPVIIGEVVTKSERRAGEEPSGVRSGILRFNSHPIPVTFTSLPGFPSISRPAAPATTSTGGSSSSTRTRVRGGNRTPSRGTPTRTLFTSPASLGPFPNVAIDTAFGGQRGSVIRGAGFDRIPNLPGTAFAPGTRVPGTRQSQRTRGPSLRSGGASRRPGGINNGIEHLMHLLESRLVGGIRNTASSGTRNGGSGGSSATRSTGRGGSSTSRSESTAETVPNGSPLQQFDPSIVINFLTLVALTQQQRRGGFVGSNVESRGPQSQRNASPLTATSEALDGGALPPSDSAFGPFSDGNDPSAGVDPSTIGLPPMLRQTLYSYLLPRLSSLSALVETLPGVPGLDYPIISTVPYTNFYCSSMPWPGFYADTEARCQLWHYCDLEGRQASFLCPNGTIFNQAFFVCDWWYNFDCPSAPYLYSMNERVFDIPEVEETAPHRTLTAEILDTIFLR